MCTWGPAASGVSNAVGRSASPWQQIKAPLLAGERTAAAFSQRLTEAVGEQRHQLPLPNHLVVHGSHAAGGMGERDGGGGAKGTM